MKELALWIGGWVLVVIAVLAIILVIPSENMTRYGDHLCTSQKGWGYGVTVRKCYQIGE